MMVLVMRMIWNYRLKIKRIGKMISTEYDQKIYDNCIRHAEDTEAFWPRVLDFLAPRYDKHPEVLEIYNAVEDYVYGKKNGNGNI